MTIHHIKQNQKDIAKYDTIKYFVEDFKIGIDFLAIFGDSSFCFWAVFRGLLKIKPGLDI